MSKLCFGALTVGPLQANMPPDEGAKVISRALELGVNFIDTAELYGTYGYIRKAIEISGCNPVIATKSYAYSRQGALNSIEKARKELDRDVIDIFLMHEQESRLTLKGHKDALSTYLENREKGILRAVGVSTHNVEVVEACADMPEIDVVHPIVNINGTGIGDGSIGDMLKAIKQCYDSGKGIYGMKPLGGGNLLSNYDECIEFVLGLPCLHSVAIGMQTVMEVEMNVRVFSGIKVPGGLLKEVRAKKRKLHIHEWCTGCGKCVARCAQSALSINDKIVTVDMDKCLLCGYCGTSCPQFCIKVI